MKKLTMLLLVFLVSQIVMAGNTNPIGFKSLGNSTPKSIKIGGGDFEQGVMIFSLGYGTPNLTAWFLSGFDNYDGYTVSAFGPLHAKFEYAATDEIGIGLSVNHVSTTINYQDNALSTSSAIYNYKFNISNTAFNVRINYHFLVENSLDLYTGVGFGYRIGSYKYSTNDPNFDAGNASYNGTVLPPIGFETTIGMRYYFTELFGAYVEAGLAKSIIQGGLVLKL